MSTAGQYGFPNARIVENAVATSLLTDLRERDAKGSLFQRKAEELAGFVLYEAMRDLPGKQISVETPVSTCDKFTLTGEKPSLLVAVLGAGMVFIPSFNKLELSGGCVGLIAARRNHTTHVAELSYDRLPKNLSEYQVFVGEPMLATGGSASDVVGLLKSRGAVDVTLLCIIAARKGVLRMAHDFPEVKIFSAGLDDNLTSNAYIDPGLGDFGDRYLGVIPQ